MQINNKWYYDKSAIFKKSRGIWNMNIFENEEFFGICLLTKMDNPLWLGREANQ